MKLFFTDMDGTLLNDEKQIPARNKQAIQKILSKGHGFIICSGRSRAAIAPFIETARYCREWGLGLNAGHDLSLDNLAYYHRCIPWTDEVSIGHALISDALYLGLKQTIALYLKCLEYKKLRVD